MSARVRRERVIPVSAAVVLLAALLVAYPFPMLTVAVVAYLGYIPFGWRLYHRLAERHAAAAAPAAEPAPPRWDAGTTAHGPSASAG